MGSISSKSRVIPLLKDHFSIQFTAETLDVGGPVDTIYTDFIMAFDQIDHDILLRKLDIVGVSVPLLSVFKSYFAEQDALCALRRSSL